MAKRTKQIKQNKKRAYANTPALTPALKKAFVRFIEDHPPKRFTKNMRQLLFDYLMQENGGEPFYFKMLIHDLNGLFDLLDTVDGEMIKMKEKNSNP